MSKVLKQARVSKRRRQLKNKPIEIIEEPIKVGADEDHLEDEDRERSPQEEAFFILEKAKAHASEIVAKAKSDSEEMERLSREKGFNDGYEEGLQKGLESGQNELGAVVESLKSAIQEMRELKEDLHDKVKDELVDLIIDTTGKIVASEIETNRNVVVNTVKNALEKVRDKDRIIVRLNPEDIESIKVHKQELLNQIDGINHLEVTEDPKISRGSCLVESDSGKIDARVETKLLRVGEALKTGGDLPV